jgi:hypothetical protein
MATRRTPGGHPDQLQLDWSDEERIERLVEARMAERFEVESFHWRLRLVAIETIMLGLLMLTAGFLLGQPTMMVVKASLIVAASCFATGVLLLSLSASAARLLSRLTTGRGK